MRKTSPLSIFAFLLLAALIIALALLTARWLPGRLPLGEYRPVCVVLAALLWLYFYAGLVYRLLLRGFPLRAGEIVQGTRQDWVYGIYVLFFLLFFNTLLRGGWLPIPLLRLVYLALGAKLGANTYISGIAYDPLFIQIGANTLIGESALLTPHVIEKARLAHYPIKIGNGVTIGAHAVILADVEIGDGAIVATGAVVLKGTRIGAQEVWGGVPAQLIKRLNA